MQKCEKSKLKRIRKIFDFKERERESVCVCKCVYVRVGKRKYKYIDRWRERESMYVREGEIDKYIDTKIDK